MVPWNNFLPPPPSFLAEHNATWYGMSLWPTGSAVPPVSSPPLTPSPLAAAAVQLSLQEEAGGSSRGRTWGLVFGSASVISNRKQGTGRETANVALAFSLDPRD